MWRLRGGISAWSVFALLAAVAWGPNTAHGGMINIILSGMDVSYLGTADGGNGALFDVMGGYAGGNLTPSESDDITTAVFQFDSSNVGTQVSTALNQMYGDLKVDGVGASVPLNVYQYAIGSNGNTFGFDWFDESGKSLRLNMDTVDMIISPGVFFFTGTATVASQNLPYGLEFDTSESVQFSYTATLPAIGGGGVSPTSLASGSGALTISGLGSENKIPEPATVGLLIVGVLGLGAGRLRRSAATPTQRN